MRRAAKVDRNQAEIVSAVRAVGVSVIDCSAMGRGMPDLIFGTHGVTALVEVKNPKTRYGRKGLSELQAKWKDEWKGGVYAVVDGVDAALRLVAVMRNGGNALAFIGATA